MSEQKSVVVGAVVHAKAEYDFYFEFKGDVDDEEEMKRAAWDALNSDAMLAPLRCVRIKNAKRRRGGMLR